MSDESWPMVEEAVLRLFDEIADSGHVALGARLAELGWADIEEEYPVQASELLFRAQGRSLAHTDCLDKVMVTELAERLNEPVDGVVLPAPSDGCSPASRGAHVSGIVLGPPAGRLLLPVADADGGVSVGVVDADELCSQPMNTFDPSVHWTKVSGSFSGALVEATGEWQLAVAAAHNALATELVAITDEMLGIAINHAKVRIQFGTAIGSFQSPRHALAAASAKLEGARALLGESRRHGGRLAAQAAKAASGRAHKVASDTAMQVCGAIGLTAEHDLHRYVMRGIQLDSLCGSHSQIEEMVAEWLFGDCPSGFGLPTVVGWGPSSTDLRTIG